MEHPSLIVFDLNNVAAKPLTLIPKLKAKLKKGHVLSLASCRTCRET